MDKKILIMAIWTAMNLMVVAYVGTKALDNTFAEDDDISSPELESSICSEGEDEGEGEGETPPRNKSFSGICKGEPEREMEVRYHVAWNSRQNLACFP